MTGKVEVLIAQSLVGNEGKNRWFVNVDKKVPPEKGRCLWLFPMLFVEHCMSTIQDHIV